ncbi:transcriptional regulator [Ktedonosporobacter rubrisoli]|uniref:Transcriptional regulator n=1 Tax=Ktedonosporobacter rubrisoli TaxID=2509675 RepID=A0A4P6JNQ6_KTERU|nr:helix-turn-helix domain-containing protein [Ktedonosporobacter rubrisoli]QBD76949.1 transcriptional regulator [Ktedonosporobacter rubrisoli]
MGENSSLERTESGDLTPLYGTYRGLDLVSDKWTVRVVYELRPGGRRLSDLQRAVKGISQRMLIHTLRNLERNGLVKRTVYPVVPPKVEYYLTPLGKTLMNPLLSLCAWTNEHIEEMEKAREQYDKETEEVSINGE